ncbi:L,D-transpeptidase [Stackebrandtia nassauensis]|uniref:L,D-transpeptidase n=1 Tax=Stackebrandtia nassauensis TaxID=283811 RepID=UPI00145F75E9|nr:Ig-like domain-containing protein [Stackebrandtia nassauensis]
MTAFVGVLALAVSAACGGGSAKFVDPDKSVVEISSVTPKKDAKDVPVTTELEWKIEKGELIDVQLLDPKGKKVKGDLAKDKKSWIPAERLEWGTKYSIKVTGTDKNKLDKTSKSTFTTMDKPGNFISASLFNGDGRSYGKAMPVIMDFPREFSVPEDQRASVEKRLRVTTEPEQPGAWHWFSGNHLEYRAKEFWKPGTKINVELALAGHPLGGDVYGGEDVKMSMNINDDDREIKVSNEKKSMTAFENGKSVKSMDISLGKKGNESYSGTMTVMEKLEKTEFNTFDEPQCKGKKEGEDDDCYKTKIKYAQRLTWSGQFIHSAPWSVADQGKRNVSHGCVNVSEKNAKWIFEFASVGTPVIVEGTGFELPAQDGFTAYNLSWEDFLKGSYLSPPGEGDDKKDDEKD